ncbi:hypothetical protein ACJJIC_15070 [Microbulbifer sp. ANSA002]|uniref:hypothetical protein n=1 Tax=unclassified Microbulbifer TaxID=2619833 RepID=UPI004042D08E
MSVSESKREETIKGLSLRPELVDLFLEKDDLGAFSRYFEKPEYFYSVSWPQFKERELLPLWEFSEEIYALDLIENKLISFNIESPEEYEIFDSIDQGLFNMIELHTWEFGGEDQEISEAIEFAKRVKLPNIQGLLDLFANYMACTEEMISEYKNAL